MNIDDTESPTVRNERSLRKESLQSLQEVLKESHEAVIDRFDRAVLSGITEALKTKDCEYLPKMIRLLFSSILSSRTSPIFLSFSDKDFTYFMDTVGAIYPVFGTHGSISGYSLREGYVIASLLERFKEEMNAFRLSESLELLHKVIISEGRSTSAKGVAFESVCLYELSQAEKKWTIASFCSALNVPLDGVDSEIMSLPFPTHVSTDNEMEFLKKRSKLWLRPSNQMRPDGIAFPANNIMITVGIKLYSSVVGFSVCQDNLFTTDARLFFIGKTGIETDSLKRKAWVNEQTRNPITFCLRLHFVFPNPVNQFVLPPNSKNEVHVLVTLANCEAIFSKPTCDLLKFICEP